MFQNTMRREVYLVKARVGESFQRFCWINGSVTNRQWPRMNTARRWSALLSQRSVSPRGASASRRAPPSAGTPAGAQHRHPSVVVAGGGKGTRSRTSPSGSTPGSVHLSVLLWNWITMTPELEPASRHLTRRVPWLRDDSLRVEHKTLWSLPEDATYSVPLHTVLSRWQF